MPATQTIAQTPDTAISEIDPNPEPLGKQRNAGEGKVVRNGSRIPNIFTVWKKQGYSLAKVAIKK